MLELVDVPESGRKTGYMSDDTATYKKGSFILLSGTFSAGDIASLPAGQKNKPGFAKAGDKKLVRGWAATGGRAFPIDKLIFEREDSDFDLDTVKKGEAVTYYTAGTFRTTEYTDLTAGTKFGDYLKLTASGTLTSESTVETETSDSVARIEGLFQSNTLARDHRLEFTLISGDD